MLTFLPLDPKACVPAQQIRHASIVGHENVPVAGDITLDDGLVHVVKSSADASGLSLMVDLSEHTRDRLGLRPDLQPLGEIILQTCLLPERDRPYLLELELARQRIMLVLTKLEEYQLFDLPPEHQVMRLIDEARVTMTRVLVAQRDDHPEAVAELRTAAYTALWLAIEASERLCLIDAVSQLPGRISGKLYESTLKATAEEPTGRGSSVSVLNPNRTGIVLSTRPAVGCVVSPGSFTPAGQSAVKQACDFVTVPMRWSDLEPSEGRYEFTGTDRWIEWAVRSARKPVVAGPLVDFRPGCVPDWLYIWENDYETLRELVYEHVKAVVTRYRRTVARWTAVSGLHANLAFGLSFEQMMDLTKIAVLVIRKLHPQARVQLEITEPWGEYFTSNRQALPPSLFAEMVAQSGIQIDTVGLRVQMGAPRRGHGSRDLGAFSAMLDHYAVLDRPLAITAMGVPSASLTPEADPLHHRPETEPESENDEPGERAQDHQDHQDHEPTPSGGSWHCGNEGWSPQAQAEWLSAAGTIALAKPFVQTICWQELSDIARSPEIPGGGLLDANDKPRPALERLTELRRVASGEILIDDRFSSDPAQPTAAGL